MTTSNGKPKEKQREILPIPDQAYAGFQGHVEQTARMVFSADETTDVGMKRGSPMIPDMPAGRSEFNGTVQVVVIEATELLSMIVARQ